MYIYIYAIYNNLHTITIIYIYIISCIRIPRMEICDSGSKMFDFPDFLLIMCLAQFPRCLGT